MKRVCGKSRTEKNIFYIFHEYIWKIFSKSMNSHIYQMNFLDMSQGHAPDSLVKYITTTKNKQNVCDIIKGFRLLLLLFVYVLFMYFQMAQKWLFKKLDSNQTTRQKLWNIWNKTLRPSKFPNHKMKQQEEEEDETLVDGKKDSQPLWKSYLQ